jgi:hypothetical protein
MLEVGTRPDDPGAGEGRSSPVRPVCPVCHCPDSGASVCAECGWQLIGDYVLGPATPADRQQFNLLLADKQRHYDLRAAVRVAEGAGQRDRAVLERVARLARGGMPSGEQIDRAVAEIDAEDPQVSMTQSGLMFALTRLVTGKTDAIAFLEVGPDTIDVQTLVLSPIGVPARLAEDSLPWTDVVPRLPSNADLRRLLMAGGVGERPVGDGGEATPTTVIDMLDEAIGPALARLMAAGAAAPPMRRADGSPGSSVPSRAPRRVDTVLVRRTLHWPVLKAAVERARKVLRPTAEIVVEPGVGGLDAVVDAAAGRAPLRHGYELVLVDVDEDSGEVTVRPRTLFGAGVAVTPDAESTVAIPVETVPGHAADQVALPIVARRSPGQSRRDAALLYQDPVLLAKWRPLAAMPVLDGVGQGKAELRVTLRGPGRLEVHPAAGLLSQSALPVGWPELITMLPERLPPGRAGMGELDLVLLLELGGDDQIVADRVSLVRDVVAEFRGHTAVKVAVLGYRDHFGRHRVDAIDKREDERAALVVGCPLMDPADAWSVFSLGERWLAVPVGDHHAAPVEDALQIVAGPQWRWRSGARHAIVVVGGRPPHPPKQARYGEGMLPCPHRYSWRSAVERLSDEQAVECFAVRDRPDTAKATYAKDAWQQLGAQRVCWAGDITATQLARLVGQAARTAVVEIGLARHGRAAPAAWPNGEADR